MPKNYQLKRNMVCSVEGCSNLVGKHGGRGMCLKHYDKVRRQRDTAFAKGVCKIPECQKPAERKGLCKAHYEQVRTHGKITKIITSCSEGRKRHPLWSTYESMKGRCYSINSPQYVNYGARGIKVCERWLRADTGFKSFCTDMGERPKGYTLDRINVDGDYCPENCRWANRHTQAVNTRKTTDCPNISVRLVRDDQRFDVHMAKMGKVYFKTFVTLRDAIAYRTELERKLWKM